MDEYQHLTQEARVVNQRREELISEKHRLQEQIKALDTRIRLLDERVERIYDLQYVYWDSAARKKVYKDRAVKIFFSDPSIKIIDLAKKIGLTPAATRTILGKHFEEARERGVKKFISQ